MMTTGFARHDTYTSENPLASYSTATVLNILRGSLWFMAAVRSVAKVQPPNWVIGGGVIRTIVWDHLHGRSPDAPGGDIDVAYFDPAGLDRIGEREFESALSAENPEVDWDVKNQAAVHLWYFERYGYHIPPVVSIEDAVSRFPETATSVAVRWSAGADLELVAPCGVDDLLGLVLRRNPKQVTRQYFSDRLRSKRVVERWPGVEVIND